jgi:hypothetical protein
VQRTFTPLPAIIDGNIISQLTREAIAVPDATDKPTFTGENIEVPASFYLGREYDLAQKKTLDKAVMYEARDLTTHGVVVGMTGSGKTGLCINLLEEAAIDGIPCIIVDLKGDLVNLLLLFEDLKAEDFQKWINPEDARLKGMPEKEYAQQTADKWRQGIADWGQTPERVKLLKDAAERRVYTPGSEAGLPLSILGTFAAPKGKVPREELNQKIESTATALLGLTGISADPVQSREHILISQLLLHAWTLGKDLDLPQLINDIQVPPLAKIGAFDVDTFYPEKDRLKLAVALNNILAAPSFSTWIEGEPLDLAKLLSGGKKPRQLIFYLAHLEDTQRMFFLTLLLEEVLSWTRRQPGTSNLRAVVYFDEVFGYLPPYPANPPTKLPLMTLIKQARAFGVGLLLATQNPVDLDYKALSNAGTWFVGKLQTERDKARLIEGLLGVAAEVGTLSDRGYLESVISALGSRVFLMHDVHRGKPILVQSRQALSFLRGPMTREQVAELMAPLKVPSSPAGAAAIPVAMLAPKCQGCQAELVPGMKFCPQCGAPAPVAAAAKPPDSGLKPALPNQTPEPPPVVSSAPVLPSEIAQFYLPITIARPAAARGLVYQPRLYGVAEVVFVDKKKGKEYRRTYRLLTMPPQDADTVRWATAERAGDLPALSGRDLENLVQQEPGAFWAELPESLGKARKLKSLEKTLAEHLYSNARLVLLENAKLGLTSEPGEDIVAFRERCRLAVRQEAEKILAAEKLKFEPKFLALGVPIPDGHVRGEESLLDTFNPLNWFRAAPKKTDESKIDQLHSEWLIKQADIVAQWKKVGDEYAENTLAPRRQDVQVTQFGLAWLSFWEVDHGGQIERVPAYRNE